MYNMTHLYVWHDWLIRVIGLIYLCDMTHCCVWHHSWTDVVAPGDCCHRLTKWTGCVYMYDMTYSCVWHDLCADVVSSEDCCHHLRKEPCILRTEPYVITKEPYMYVLTEEYVFSSEDCCHHLTRWTWLIYMCEMTPSYMWHNWFVCVTWLVHWCSNLTRLLPSPVNESRHV